MGEDLESTIASAESVGFVRGHWRGDYSLARSYWVHFLLAVIFPSLALSIFAIVAEDGYPPSTLARVALAVFAVQIPLVIWAGIGTWISATKHRAAGGSGFWAGAAKVTIAFIFIARLIYGLQHGTEIRELWQAANRTSIWPAFRVQVAKRGDSLLFQGGFNEGASGVLRTALKMNPRVRRLYLESGGGWLYEGRAMARLVQAHHLITVVVGECSSACTIAYLAGRERLLTEGARIGFHRPSIPLSATDGDDLMRLTYTQAGLPRFFIQKALSIPYESMWYPPTTELQEAGVSTRVAAASELRFYALSLSDRERILKDMRGSALFRAAEASFPDAFAALMDDLVAASQREENDAQFLGRVRRHAMGIVRTAFPLATDRILLERSDRVVRELRYLKTIDPKLCAARVLSSADPALEARATTALDTAGYRKDMDDLMARMVRSASQANARSFSAEDLRRSIGFVRQNLSPRERQLLDMERAAPSYTDREYCSATLRAEELASRLPDRDRIAILLNRVAR